MYCRASPAYEGSWFYPASKRRGAGKSACERGESVDNVTDEVKTEQLGVTSMAEGDPAIEGLSLSRDGPASLSPVFHTKTIPATRPEKREATDRSTGKPVAQSTAAVDYSTGKPVAQFTASHNDAMNCSTNETFKEVPSSDQPVSTGQPVATGTAANPRACVAFNLGPGATPRSCGAPGNTQRR